MPQVTTLDDVYKVLSPEPLRTEQELNDYYRAELNQIRGGYRLQHLCLQLRRAVGSAPFKAFLMGHQGVGKSTELSKLSHEMKGSFLTITLNAALDLDPTSFQPFDVLLLMLMEVAERTAQPVDKGGAGSPPSNHRLQEILDWFSTVKITAEKKTEVGAQADAGVGLTSDSLWAKALGLFGSLKGEMKYASSRTTETVQYRLNQISALVKAANRLLAECNEILRKATGKEWLFVWEGFDRIGIIPPEKIENLFLTYSNVLRELNAHCIFTIPIDFGYAKTGQFSFPCLLVPDTPVFHKNHAPNVAGRKSLQTILEARLVADLFEPGQMMRLITASGGNLRDLFTLVNLAADNSLLSSKSKIGPTQVTDSIVSLRSEYERRLGQHQPDKAENPVTYAQQAERLLKIYNNDEAAEIADPVLTSLFRARAILEFNGERWLGVHPLVIDILRKQGKIAPNAQGVVPGGTE